MVLIFIPISPFPLRFYLEELVQYIEKTPKLASASAWKDIVHLPSSPFPDIKPRSWRQLYNMAAVHSSLSRVQMVGYDEKLVSLKKKKKVFNLKLNFTGFLHCKSQAQTLVVLKKLSLCLDLRVESHLLKAGSQVKVSEQLSKKTHFN